MKITLDRPISRKTLAETEGSDRLYTRVASRYHRFFVRALLAEEPIEARILHHLPHGRVLDLACGNARWQAKLRPRRYVGLDLNEAMLAEASLRPGSLALVRGNMLRLPFADQAFESVVCLFGA